METKMIERTPACWREVADGSTDQRRGPRCSNASGAPARTPGLSRSAACGL